VNDHEARQRIKAILDAGGVVCYTVHGGNRLSQRRIPLTSVLRLLRCGFVVESPHREQDREGWTLAMEGSDLDGRPLTVVLEIFEEQLLIRVVTTYHLR
jgi:hypothetical protein